MESMECPWTADAVTVCRCLRSAGVAKVKYYNRIDEELELPLDILDTQHFCSQWIPIGSQNSGQLMVQCEAPQ